MSLGGMFALALFVGSIAAFVFLIASVRAGKRADEAENAMLRRLQRGDQRLADAMTENPQHTADFAR